MNFDWLRAFRRPGGGTARPRGDASRFRNRAFLSLERLEDRAVPAQFMLNCLDDTPDANVGDGKAEDAAGNTSLRAAIQEANFAGTAHEIVLDGVQGTINLTSALPALDKHLTITGPGYDVLSVQRSINVAALFRIFEINSGKNVSISNLRIANGYADGNGGGIFNRGSLTIDNADVSGNKATKDGGGIYNSFNATLTVVQCWITYNDAWTVAGGYGGGIYNNGTAWIGFSTRILHNSAVLAGGGISNGLTATLTINDTWVNENECTSDGPGGGGIHNVGNLTMSNGEVNYNRSIGSDQTQVGGGIYNSIGTATFQNVSIMYNSAGAGGGGFFLNSGSLTLEACALQNNTAAVGPGGVFVAGSSLQFINPILPIDEWTQIP